MIKKIFLTIITLLFIQTITNAATIKFVQVTDSHYIANNQYRSEILQKAINNINDEKDIAFVVFTGDNIPYYLVIGNHDVFKNNGLSKKHYLEIVKDNNCFYKYKTPNYVFKKNGFVFIVLDGAKEIIPGSNGYYKENTLKWLDKQLTKHKNDPVIIFQHFPVVMAKEIPSHSVYKKENYLDVIDKHDNVISVVAGHLHTNGEVMRNGVYHISSPTLIGEPPVYKVITVVTTKGFSPMIYTELKEVQ